MSEHAHEHGVCDCVSRAIADMGKKEKVFAKIDAAIAEHYPDVDGLSRDASDRIAEFRRNRALIEIAVDLVLGRMDYSESFKDPQAFKPPRVIGGVKGEGAASEVRLLVEWLMRLPCDGARPTFPGWKQMLAEYGLRSAWVDKWIRDDGSMRRCDAKTQEPVAD